MVVTASLASFGVRGHSARSRRTISVHDLGADCGALNSTYMNGSGWGGMGVCTLLLPL